MRIMGRFITKIEMLKLQRLAFTRSRQISGLSRSCVTYRHHLSGSPSQPALPNHLSGLRGFCTSSVTLHEQSPLKKWEYKLDPFGKLVLSSSSVDCKVSPIDPNEYPEQDLVVVSLHGSENAVSCDQIGDDVHVLQTDEAEGASLDIKIPIKYGLAANFSGKSNLDISTLENQNISVEMDSGTCTLTNIKSGTIKITSKSGDIVSKKTLQGNATFRTGKAGVIDVNKPVGNDLCLESESGDIKVTSLYAAKSYFNTRRGNVDIGSCHKETMINMQQLGNLKIATLDGSLLASVGHGDVDIHITNHDNVQILLQKGNINLKMANPEETEVELRANTVEIADDISPQNFVDQEQQRQRFITGSFGITRPATITETPPKRIVATTGDGNISISKQDWKDTLKLKYKIHSE